MFRATVQNGSKLNEEANYRSSQLARDEDLQKIVAMVEILPVVALWPAAR